MATLPERIGTLDTIRGVAVLGILLLNIVAFAMPQTAYMNPRAYGGWHDADLAAYLINFVLFDGKMRGLFSFLFGASMLMVIERAELSGQSPARVHFSRMIWLLIFGLIHLWLIWWGDILTLYAMVGMIAWAFRNKDAHSLIGHGILLLCFQWLLMILMPIGMHATELAAARPDATADARHGLEQLQQGFGVPSAQWIAGQLALMRGGYWGILSDRLANNITTPLNSLLFVGAETLAYMLFGMAALKSGFLTGAWERRRYWRWVAVGFGIGIPVYAALGAWMVAQQFSMMSVAIAVMAASVPVRSVMIVGWAALIILALRPGGALTQRLAAAGRMAFSNYLGTSLICTTLFYGYGFGWFGYWSRAQIYGVVLAVWVLILLWSKPWLEHFRYGPLEWLWRSLARRQWQPMRGGALSATQKVATDTQ